MAEQIIQKLGFDAGQAIAEIGNLNGSLGSLTTKLLDVSSAAKGFNRTNVSKQLGRLAGGAKKAEQQLKKLEKQTNKQTNALKNTNKASVSLVLSFQTLSRIALAQGAVRGINAIQSALREGISTAVDFNLALAEISAISPNVGGITSFGDEVNRLNKELIETSKSFGFDVLDLAEAKYQEFSNQVKGSAESNQLFISANKLARISASEVGESVGALSSVLNSYGQTVDDADRVSAVLFKTIELGRTRLSDIADQLGNVTPLAKSAGIEFEELAGALATITRSGVSPSRALTQIRAIINQLQKPTQALSDLFTETFQVANIEEAINKFGGLQGVIEAVASQANGDSRKIAKFFSNIRARNAFISLTDQTDQLSSSIEQMREVSDNASPILNALLAEFDAQDAVKFQKALNELRITFVEISQTALPALTSALQILSNFLGSGSQQLTAAIGVLGIYTGKLALAGVATKGFAESTLLAKSSVIGLGVAAGLAGGFLLGQFLVMADGNRVLAASAEAFGDIEAASKKSIEQLGIDAKEATGQIRALANSSQDLLNELKSSSKGAISSIRSANDAFVSSIGGSLKDLVRSRSNFVKSLEDNISGLEDRLSKRSKEGASIREEIADNEFNRRLAGLDKVSQAFATQNRAERALNAAQGVGGNNEGLEKRVELLTRAKDLAEEAVSSAEQSGNRVQIFNAEQNLERVLRSQLETKIQQNNLDTRSAAAAEAKLDVERRNLEKLKEAVKDFRDNLSIFNDGGTLLGPEERDAAIKNAKEALKEIQDLAFSRSDISTGDLLGTIDQQLDFNKSLGKINVKFDGLQEELIKELERVGRENVLKIPVELIVQEGGFLGLDIDIDKANPLGGFSDAIKQSEDRTVSLTASQLKLSDASAKVVEQQQKINSLITDIDSATKAAVGGSIFGVNLGALEVAKKEFFSVINTPLITDEQIKNTKKALDAFNQPRVGDVPGAPFLGETTFIDDFISQLKLLQKLQAEAIDSQNVAGQLKANNEFQQAINSSLEAQAKQSTNQDEIIGKVKQTTVDQDALNLAQGTSALLTQGISGAYNTANTAANTLLQTQLRLNQAQSSGGGQSPTPRMFGGPIFRAFGGFTPKGSDTIPAMLSPGESVINARSTRRFSSQINAMNAGVKPVFRAEGGVVNNSSVNVGDINVNGTSDPDATARSVMKELKREFRRGTSSRFK